MRFAVFSCIYLFVERAAEHKKSQHVNNNTGYLVRAGTGNPHKPLSCKDKTRW